MADEGKYHTKCYVKLFRKVTKSQGPAKSSSIAMAWFVSELEIAASKGNIYDLDEVWNCYTELCNEAVEEIPASFQSRSCLPRCT